MESLTDPAPLDPELATTTHQAEERERVAFVLFMLLAIVVLLGFLGWRMLFGGPDWKPATESWMQIEGVAVPMPDPWAVEEAVRIREESGAEVLEAAFRFEKEVLLDPLAARWEEFLVQLGFQSETEITGNGETRRILVRGEKSPLEVKLDLRTWDRTGHLTMTKSTDGTDAAWPFEQAQNTATYTAQQIVKGGDPILYVTHDMDGDWQFLTGGAARMEDMMLVSLGNMVELDSSLMELHDLAVGWSATRSSPESPWQREPSPSGDE